MQWSGWFACGIIFQWQERSTFFFSKPLSLGFLEAQTVTVFHHTQVGSRFAPELLATAGGRFAFLELGQLGLDAVGSVGTKGKVGAGHVLLYGMMSCCLLSKT
jgi:hypothetical protein